MRSRCSPEQRVGLIALQYLYIVPSVAGVGLSRSDGDAGETAKWLTLESHLIACTLVDRSLASSSTVLVMRITAWLILPVVICLLERLILALGLVRLVPLDNFEQHIRA